ncbi:hypothetical protein GCM10007160_37310 [Litchfieldella qijiaojingensis]|uniref:DUF86 domain-containing protein n=1 Tax=Litchfieldella qijiaojingensis TaxID=980347 RepID=A0ABQ2Z8X4_9GAMM|nr:DUF86 domain-containing protein [Halomonas qijiaojingensis]GGY06357.1 hypothetical protein GCM10007160_37310 [Halomonas qijiaojingensis]
MDRQVINQKLESLRRCIARLESRCPDDAKTLATDLDAQDIVSLNLTRAVQICVDIAAHWIAEHGDVTAPVTMGQTFDVLAQAGIISPQLATNMRKSVGFRNIVVHNYENVNWDMVFSICKNRLDDFRQFAEVFIEK